MKKLLVFLITITFIFTMAGCGSSNQGSSGTGSSKDEKITLRIAWWGGQPRHDYTMKIIEMYEKENPNVKIEPEFANWDDYWKKLAPMAAANNLPDIIQMDTSYISQYAEKGQLTDLTKYVDDGTINTDNIDENSLTGGIIKDKLYGFSTGSTVLSVISNDQMLEKTGVEIDGQNWTWDDFTDIAIKLANANGTYGTNPMYPADIFFPYYLKTKGEQFYNEDGTGLAYKDDQLFVDYFNMQLKLVDAKSFPTPDVQAQVKGSEDDFIVKGTAALTWNWSNQYRMFDDLTENPLSINLPPENATNKALYLRPTMFWSITENSKHKEEAAKFIDFYTNNIEANKLIKGERGVPLSSEVVKALQGELTESEAKVFQYVEDAKQYVGPADPPAPVGSAEVMKALDDLAEKILFKAITPKEGAKQFREQATEILGRNK